MKTDSQSDSGLGFQSDDDKQLSGKTEKSPANGAKTIQGELVRVENLNYFLKAKGVEAVRLHTDTTTYMVGEIKKGDSIEARMNNQNHTLSTR